MALKNSFNIGSVAVKTIPINSAIRLESSKVYSTAFHEAVAAGQPLRIEVERLLESKGLLDTKADNAKVFDLRKLLKELEIQLRKGIIAGRKMTKSEGKAIALEMRTVRAELTSVGTSIAQYFNNTAESAADSERLQYFVYACTVYADTGKRYWKSFDAYKSETDQAALDAASRSFLTVAAGIDENYEQGSYENQWLKKQGFLSPTGQLIREDGKLIDETGRLINSEGRFIDEAGGFVDLYGNPIAEDGTLLVTDSWDEPTEVPKEPTPI